MQRLKKRPEFLAVSASNKKWVSKSFIALFLLHPDKSPEVRVGFTTSRKLGNAVARNRIRRRLKEGVRLRMSDVTFAVSTDIVIIGRHRAKNVTFDALLNEMDKAFAFISKAHKDK